MAILIVCVLALATQGLLAHGSGNYQDCGITKVDELVDALLKHLQENSEEPMRLDDHESAIADLREGQLWGLNSLVRKGPAIVSCDGNLTRIEADVVAQEPIKARWEWSQDLRVTTLKGVAYLKFEVFEVKLVVIKDRTGENPSFVQDMEIIQLKQATVEITGLAHISWIVSKISTYVSKYFQRTIKYVLDQPLTKVFDKFLLESHMKEKASQFV